jgi:hypothetical protein
MNDLDLVRAMRANAPDPASERLATGRKRLHSATARRRTGHRRLVMILAGGVTVTAAAAVIVIRTASAGPAAPAGQPAGPAGRPAAVRLLSATQVLGRAAAAAQGRPALLPAPDQWIYEKGLKFGPGHRWTTVGWERFDGAEQAWYEHGKLVVYLGTPQDVALDATPQTAARYLTSLPTAPSALLAVIYQKLDGTPRGQWGSPDRNTAAFVALATLLSNAAGGVGVPPAHEAAVFRAMADIPGVMARPDLVDAAGQPAIGLTPGPHSGYYFLLNPRSYAMIGITTADGRQGALSLAVEVVSQPGQS